MLHARNDFMKKLIIIDTLDWKSKDVNAVYNAIISGARNGSIILCHSKDEFRPMLWLRTHFSSPILHFSIQAHYTFFQAQTYQR